MQLLPNSTFSANISGIKLYREDIEWIISTIQACKLEVALSDNARIYDNLDELIKYEGTKPTVLYIIGRNKDGISEAKVSIEKEIASLFFIAQISEKVLGYQVRDYIKERATNRNRIFHPLVIMLICNILAGIMFFLEIYFKIKTVPSAIYMLLILVPFVTILLPWPLIPIYSIILERKHEAGYWRRNSDNLKNQFMGAIIGAIIGALLTYLFKS